MQLSSLRTPLLSLSSSRSLGVCSIAMSRGQPVVHPLCIPRAHRKNIKAVAFYPALTGGSLDLWCGSLGALLSNNTVKIVSLISTGKWYGDRTNRPVAWLAVLAFSAFFTLCAALRFSLPALMASARAAERASGLIERRSLMTSREAPTTARWALTCLRRRVLACSCDGVSIAASFDRLYILPTYLRDTLSPLSPAKDGPRNAARVLALEEEGLGLSVLETEDLAVRTDEELAL